MYKANRRRKVTRGNAIKVDLVAFQRNQAKPMKNEEETVAEKKTPESKHTMAFAVENQITQRKNRIIITPGLTGNQLKNDKDSYL